MPLLLSRDERDGRRAIGAARRNGRRWYTSKVQRHDPTIPADEVARIDRRLGALGARYQIVRYPGVRPGFVFPGRDTYDARAAEDAWDRTSAFLEAHLGPATPA